MASGGHLMQQQKNAVIGRIENLKNDDLKGICRAHGETVSGTKSVLVSRCRKVLNDIISRGDGAAFDELKRRAGARDLPPVAPHHSASSSSSNSYMSPAYHSYNMGSHRAGSGLPQHRILSAAKAFRSSPFYDIVEALISLVDLPEMPSNRHTVKSNLVIKPELGQRLRSDGNLKIMLFCGESQALSSYSPAHVKFPSQIEVKVNHHDVKHNFKGLKGKDGSTKPVDVTSLLHKFGGQDNTIHITYALTQRRFSYSLYLVRNVGVDKLVERIKMGNVIAKDKVLRDMSRANADPDISATSIRMSLKDPVSTVRITLPVRSSHCNHNQCFDGAMFLQLQEQAPQWSCPVCNKTVAFESLCVDKYFEDILNRTSKAIEKVDIEPDGNWRVIKEDDDSQPNGSKARAAYDDDFEDAVDLEEQTSKANGTMRDSFPLPSLSPFPAFSINTPPLSSREPSVAQSTTSAQRQSNKRPQSAVIDLTLSDEDEPPRPAKRQSTIQAPLQTGLHSTSSNTPASFHDPRHQSLPNQTFSRSYGQADNYRPGSNLSRSSFGPLSNFNQSHLSAHQTSQSQSPLNISASSFGSQQSPVGWGNQQARPAISQQSAVFPPPNSSSNFNMPMRRPSTTAASANPNPNSFLSTSLTGPRLPPMQLHQSSSPHSPDSGLYQPWRNGNGTDWDFGSYESSPG